MTSAATIIPPHQMTFTELSLNSSVLEKDAKRLSRQTRQIFDRMNNRNLPPISTGELSDIAKQYNARIYEIREMLRPHGFKIECIKAEGGNNHYRIVKLKE